jgi:uncharacterized Zn-finger protein
MSDIAKTIVKEDIQSEINMFKMPEPNQTMSSDAIPLQIDIDSADIIVAEVVIESDSDSDQSFQPPMQNLMQRYQNVFHLNDMRPVMDPKTIKPIQTEFGFQCPVCKKTIQLKKHFNRHAQTHSGEKMYKCDRCNYGTNRKDQLNAHVFRHNGLKPFQCPLCSYAGTRKDHLATHIKSVHSGTQSKSKKVNK